MDKYTDNHGNSHNIAFRFIVFEENGDYIGCFSDPDTPEWLEIEERFNHLLDSPSHASITYTDFENQCRSIIKANPMFLDAYAHIAMHYLPPHPLDNVKTAARWCRKGYRLAMTLIPEDFSGKIEWCHLSNRPFLRLHHGLILCALHLGKNKEAITLMEQHLAWNPNDNIGVRYLIGEAYLRGRMRTEARKVLTENASQDEYPPSIYSLALLEFSEGRIVQALTWIRRGFALNPYIAEALNGRENPKPHARWHGSNHKGPDVVENYLESAQMLWEQAPHALSFLDWAFNASRGLRERAEFAEVAESLDIKSDFVERGLWIERERALKMGINEETSLCWLENSKSGDPYNLYPWEKVKKPYRIM